LAFQAAFAALLVLQTIGPPETPRWLVAHICHEEAGAVIAAITENPSENVSVKRTVLGIQQILEEERRDVSFRFKELFTWGSTQNFRRLLLAISV
jgi:hypothetical protein